MANISWVDSLLSFNCGITGIVTSGLAHGLSQEPSSEPCDSQLLEPGSPDLTPWEDTRHQAVYCRTYNQ